MERYEGPMGMWQAYEANDASTVFSRLSQNVPQIIGVIILKKRMTIMRGTNSSKRKLLVRD